MKRYCPIEYCSYPIGECQGLCSTQEEQRQDIIGQNGNDGLAYEATPMKFETRMETSLIQISHACTDSYRSLQRNELFTLEKHLQEVEQALHDAKELLFRELQKNQDITRL